MRPGGRSGIEELEGAERRRPSDVNRVVFDALVEPGPRSRVEARSLIPIETVQPGDEQVLAARLPHRIGEPVIDLDLLATLPSVRSVVASTTVRARRALRA